MRALSRQPTQPLGGLAGVALLLALALALVPGRQEPLVISLAALGAATFVGCAVPSVVRALRRRRSLVLLAVLGGLILTWIAIGIVAAGYYAPETFQPNGSLWGSFGLTPRFPPGYYVAATLGQSTPHWPWRVGRLSLLPLVLAVIAAAGGFVLVADAVRVQLGLARPPRSRWRSLTAAPSRGGRIASRAIPGVALIGLAAGLANGLLSPYTRHDRVIATLWTLAVGAVAALLIAAPIAVGLAVRLDFDKEDRAREDERRRVAAHLHDSVLQTLALIQRQAADPEAVARLARRQEHSLRAWMAGEADLRGDTFATTVREMVAEVEEQEGLKIELTVIGDAQLNGGGEELIAAAREALRNAGRHAPGAPVNVFLDARGERVELFIRDSGPGFEPASVPPERRGLRDAVIGRMAAAGGSATVDSTPGEGTEIALRLPRNGRGR